MSTCTIAALQVEMLSNDSKKFLRCSFGDPVNYFFLLERRCTHSYNALEIFSPKMEKTEQSTNCSAIGQSG